VDEDADPISSASSKAQYYVTTNMIMGLKGALLVLLLGVFAKSWVKRVWPWGLALPWLDRPSYAPVDVTNDSLRAKRK
jgi:hypothetical protein